MAQQRVLKSFGDLRPEDFMPPPKATPERQESRASPPASQARGFSRPFIVALLVLTVAGGVAAHMIRNLVLTGSVL